DINRRHDSGVSYLRPPDQPHMKVPPLPSGVVFPTCTLVQFGEHSRPGRSKPLDGDPHRSIAVAESFSLGCQVVARLPIRNALSSTTVPCGNRTASPK